MGASESQKIFCDATPVKRCAAPWPSFAPHLAEWARPFRAASASRQTTLPSNATGFAHGALGTMPPSLHPCLKKEVTRLAPSALTKGRQGRIRCYGQSKGAENG